MRFRLLAASAALLLSSSVAFADSGTGAGVGTAVKASGGIIAAGAGATGVALLTNLFGGSNAGHTMPVTRAPEISTTGTTAGVVLLLGGILVLRGRQRAQASAK